MSQFLITNNREDAEDAESILNSYVSNSICIRDLGTDSRIVFDKSTAVHKKTSTTEFFGFGTFFNKWGFKKNSISNVENYEEFITIAKNNLFGHYIFVISEGDFIYIITDKIGPLNVFYSYSNNTFTVSNSLPLVAGTSSTYDLSGQAVKEFLLKESTVGRKTIFKDIYRLMMGDLLKIEDKDGEVMSRAIYDYCVDNITFYEHMERISNYFGLLNKYNGKVATDLSGGFDTRTIAAVANDQIKNLQANTNPNPNDGGVDEKLSSEIAKKN